MIINNFNTYNFKYSTSFPVSVKQENNNLLPKPSYVNIPNETLKAYSFGKAVSQRDDIYSNTSKFAEYFEDKLKKQMQVKTTEDIQNIIDNTVKETNADEKTVCEVLYRVAQFSDYKNIQDLDMSFRDKGYDGFKNQFPHILSSSSCFKYLNVKEQFFNKTSRSFYFRKPLVILDNMLIDNFKKLDKTSPMYEYFVKVMKESNPVIIDGWNTKIDDKNMAYTMFGHEYDLQTITTSIVKEMQKTGKSLDEVLNGGIIKECKDLLGDDFEPIVIKSFDEPILTAEAIAYRMEPKMPSKEQIEKFVDITAQATYANHLEQKEVKKLICKYLDVTFEAYSTERMNTELKQLHKIIENKVKQLGKTMEDVVYIIPERNKSFSLISYQYALANNIPFDKFIEEDGTTERINKNKKEQEKGKVYVILDDVVASGESLGYSQFEYTDFIKLFDKDENTNVLFVTLHSSQKGKKYLEDVIDMEGRKGKDFFISKQFKDWEYNLPDNFPQEQIKDMEEIVAGKGFNRIGTSVVFPACITDSDTRLSALFSTFFIRYPNQKAISNNITTDWGFEKTFFKMTRDIGSYNEFESLFL